MENFKLKCYCGNEMEINQGDSNINNFKNIYIAVYDKHVKAIKISCNKCSRSSTIYYSKE